MPSKDRPQHNCLSEQELPFRVKKKIQRSLPTKPQMQIKKAMTKINTIDTQKILVDQ